LRPRAGSSAGQTADRVAAGRARAPAGCVHDAAPAAADQRYTPASQFPPDFLGQPQRFRRRPFATDHGNYHGSHYSRLAPSAASAWILGPFLADVRALRSCEIADFSLCEIPIRPSFECSYTRLFGLVAATNPLLHSGHP